MFDPRYTPSSFDLLFWFRRGTIRYWAKGANPLCPLTHNGRRHRWAVRPRHPMMHRGTLVCRTLAPVFPRKYSRSRWLAAPYSFFADFTTLWSWSMRSSATTFFLGPLTGRSGTPLSTLSPRHCPPRCFWLTSGDAHIRRNGNNMSKIPPSSREEMAPTEWPPPVSFPMAASGHTGYSHATIIAFISWTKYSYDQQHASSLSWIPITISAHQHFNVLEQLPSNSQQPPQPATKLLAHQTIHLWGSAV